ncbi:MAG: dihydrodipicolinate reductase C-terminal domain-containing protein [Balneolaceae bacterium]|nr:dihydrodipicolinate reductase C-terminal domain-containing protein [Balneolaceae bacterium]
MNVAVIGTGKTGGEVVDLVEPGNLIGPFNTGNKPTAKKLQSADVVIIFVPGSAVKDIFDDVLESGVPAVWGSTGYQWPENLDERLKQGGIKWLRASNFSLGMNIVRKCISVLSKGSELLPEPEFHIHEIHHTGKVDAPSGTAISWKEWLNKDADITSERKGDIKGIHELEVKTDSESIFLKHQAHNRAVFAKGALWSARQLLRESMPPGLHSIESVFDDIISE